MSKRLISVVLVIITLLAACTRLASPSPTTREKPSARSCIWDLPWGRD